MDDITKRDAITGKGTQKKMVLEFLPEGRESGNG